MMMYRDVLEQRWSHELVTLSRPLANTHSCTDAPRVAMGGTLHDALLASHALAKFGSFGVSG